MNAPSQLTGDALFPCPVCRCLRDVVKFWVREDGVACDGCQRKGRPTVEDLLKAALKGIRGRDPKQSRNQ